jgi:hypothetical protein
MIIVDRVTTEADLNLCGYDEQKILIVLQSNTFMTTKLFRKWAEEVFFPSIEEKRSRRNCQGPCIVIMGSLGCHYDTFLTECDARSIYVIFLAPHSRDQCQSLDLVTFALLKRYFSQIHIQLSPHGAI